MIQGYSAGATEEDQELVGDQLAATAGEERRQTGQACPVLPDAVGGEPSDAAAPRDNGRKDSRFAGCGGEDASGGCSGTKCRVRTAPCRAKTAAGGDNAIRGIEGWRLGHPGWGGGVKNRNSDYTIMIGGLTL